MLNDLKLNITSLQSKIEKLIFLHEKVLEDNLKLQALIEGLQQQISEQNTQIEVLENENKDLHQKQTFRRYQQNIDTHNVSNKQIDEMMRDIDKCIALLSINKKNVELKLKELKHLKMTDSNG
jgi:cell division protein FtsB